MAKKAPHPRKQGGGRSTRYDRRRAARGVLGAHAPEWSDAAAASMLRALEVHGEAQGTQVSQTTMQVLGSAALQERLIRSMKASSYDEANARAVLAVHAQRYASASDEAQQKKRARAFLKPLRERHATRTQVTRLEMARKKLGKRTFHEWLSADASSDRMRDIRKSERTQCAVWQSGNSDG